MQENPFEVTKAVDFSDEEIAQTWVDLPGGGFGVLTPPRSPMPRFVVGGKGGGRTHLMRYYSYPLQRIRHGDALLDGILRDGYLGVYLRCSGLNASRFSGKGSADDTWAAVFAYYLDLWLGRLVLDSLGDLLGSSEEIDEESMAGFVSEIGTLFTSPLPSEVEAGGLSGLAAHLRQLQQALDSAVNNSALTRTLDLNIATNPGSLVFGIPASACSHFVELSDVRIAYLIDEFENLTVGQQMYVNTLVREKELPSTFLVGSRLWGIKTRKTLSGDEENKLGSEFDQTVLEDTYSQPDHNYRRFCTEIVRRRLEAYDVGAFSDPYELFETRGEASVEDRARALMTELNGESSPWMSRLRRSLLEAGLSSSQAEAVAGTVAIPEDPLGEKFALFSYYRLWAEGTDLAKAATRAVDVASERRVAGSKAGQSYKHYRRDLLAQLLHDLAVPQEYNGLESFIQLSGYLPRNLLIVLKQITRWALFLEDHPFRGGRVSLRAQAQGVHEASEWFLADATGLGRLGADSQRAVRRLGEFLTAHRFSDKPVEVECAQIEVNPQSITDSAIECLQEAVNHSLLLESGTGRRDRNTSAYHQKYQLNPMLAPLFSLPLARRGCLSLAPSDANAIFDRASSDQDFARARDRRLAELNAPFGRVTGQGKLSL